MNVHGKDIKLFAGNSNRALAEAMARRLGISMGNCEVSKFSDGEIQVNIGETVRGSDVFVVQSTSTPVNTNLMELLIMIDAFKRASAGRITAVIPYYGYARQDRKSRARDPITARLVADLITAAGADRVLTMDLHASQIQGFFDIPVDHLQGAPILTRYFEKRPAEYRANLTVVSPDLGSVARARRFAEKLEAPLAIVDKRRPRANVSEVMNIIGEVEGRDVLIVDDMIDTAGTLCRRKRRRQGRGRGHPRARRAQRGGLRHARGAQRPGRRTAGRVRAGRGGVPGHHRPAAAQTPGEVPPPDGRGRVRGGCGAHLQRQTHLGAVLTQRRRPLRTLRRAARSGGAPFLTCAARGREKGDTDHPCFSKPDKAARNF